jgi:hypothetical protein
MSRPQTPAYRQTNGLYTGNNSPQTPLNHSFALIEYAANPTPTPPERVGQDASAAVVADAGVPLAFLLPNGTPDVSLSDVAQHALILEVSPTDSYVQSLRSRSGDTVDSRDQSKQQARDKGAAQERRLAASL